MPKMKTHKGAKKRFKVTGTGKVMFSKSLKRHKLVNKNRKRLRSLSSAGIMNKTDSANIKKLLPYS